ncbi:multidrug ABC transporter ATP-binding protein [Candidatus Pacearchaeota archaeon CG10_big_fil_rev_8_21_14_0_10_34_76]|nr:MAG: multidrug ABC transporter ATP-binding protein [Candidatus Pacearchaeota archaeon CG10_big_fil_rev_8_21_14_0_10_34_76]
MDDKEKIISVRNLVKKFKSFTAVDNISFSVDKGEVFAFLGPNGAGKTTTIRMLTTMLKPTSGNVSLNGFDPIKQQHQARSSFGIVFQDFSLDNELTALENLKFHSALYGVPKRLSEERIEFLLKLVDLWDKRNNFIKTFSGGMKRRLEIARGLIHHPKILFLDEPTLGLDPQTRNKMWDYIINLNKNEGMTVFFTTHYMHEAEAYADRIAIIDHGKIISMGTSTKLKKQTKSKSLEEAFLNLTGHEIRDESGGAIDKIRASAKTWGNR